MLKINNIILVKIILLIGILSIGFPLHGQSYPEPEFSEKFLKNLKSEFTTYEDQYARGKKILKVSSSDAEFARSYGNMGYAKYKLFQFSEAIPLMEKAKDYAYKSNYVRFMFGMNTALKDAYKKVGLQEKSDECWNEAIRIAEKYNDKNLKFSVYDIYAVDSEKIKDYPKAISYRKKQLELIKDKRNILTSASINSTIAYDYLKINKSNEARSYLDKATPPIENEKIKSEIQELEIHYLAKGLLAYHDQNEKDAKKWFQLALDEAKKRNNKESSVLISEELTNTNIDFPNNKIVFDEYIATQNRKINETEKVINQDERNKRSEIKLSKSYIKYLSIAIIIVLLFSLTMFFLHRKRHKEIIVKFEKILEEAKNKETLHTSSIAKRKSITKDIKVDDKETHLAVHQLKNEFSNSSISISIEKEKELLSKIEEFEKGREFTEKSYTMAKLSSSLETNGVYINFVLQKYRDKKFSDYINEIRIKYIVGKLISNPEYLNYKISYLSDICGFSNHSRFTQIFKKELGISPSEFISKLVEKNKKEVNQDRQ